MKSEVIGGFLYISMFFGIIVLLAMLTSGCTTINYHMDGNLFYRCQKTVLDKNYDCEKVNEERFKKDI